MFASLPKRFNFKRFVARFVVAPLIVIAIVSVTFVIFGLIFTLTYGLINGFTEAYNFLKSLWNHPETLPMLLPLYIGMSLMFFGLLGP